MRVEWSPLALARLMEIADFIREDKPGAARLWVEGILAVAESLADLPDRGRIVPEVGREDIREVIHGGYRVIYKVDDDRVSIATVRHGRRLLDVEEL